jgi:hypothetical protein
MLENGNEKRNVFSKLLTSNSSTHRSYVNDCENENYVPCSEIFLSEKQATSTKVLIIS